MLTFGSVSFRHTSLNNTNSVSVAPGVLFFSDDGFAVGLSVLYAYTTGVPLAGQTARLIQGIHSAGFEPIVGGTIPIGDRESHPVREDELLGGFEQPGAFVRICRTPCA